MNIINNTLYLKNKLHEFINKKTNNFNIYKTLNSIIYQKNDILYCFNNDYYKKINIKKNSQIYSNEKFYIVINNNNILFIDEYFKKKCIDTNFNISNILIKENYIIVNNDLKSVLVNICGMIYFVNCEIYDLYDKVLFHSENKSYIITELGFINTMVISETKVKNLVNILKKSKGFDNFINMYFEN